MLADPSTCCLSASAPVYVSAQAIRTLPLHVPVRFSGGTRVRTSIVVHVAETFAVCVKRFD